MANMPTRPWRIERSWDHGSGKWRALSTFTTKELAEDALVWYERRGARLRISNRITGEVIEADHA